MSDEVLDKREADRLEHPVLVAYRSVDRFLSDFGTNLSMSGVFVNTAQPLDVGTPVRLLVSLPDQEEPCELMGRVIRVVTQASGGTTGMGIEFVDLDERTRERIADLVSGLRKELGQSGSER